MRIAIVGASGAVGHELLNVLEKTILPIDSVTLYGSHRSAGRTLPFRNKELTIRLLSNDAATDFSDIDIAFVSAGASVSKEFAGMITAGGALMIDNSSAFRLDDDVPLVVPEVNGEQALDAPRRIIANPNCTTIQLVVALWPIHLLSPIDRVHVATYQAASGAGAAAMEELKRQHSEVNAGQNPTVERFAHQLAYNLIPHIDVFQENDYTKEEMKMFRETRKIMNDPEIKVSATCVRVPVLRAHSEAVWIHTGRPVTVEEAREAFLRAKGVELIDEPLSMKYPMPHHLTGLDPVFVGRIRKDLADPNGLTFWTVSDQIRKGAALNAVQIAEYLHLHSPTLKH